MYLWMHGWYSTFTLWPLKLPRHHHRHVCHLSKPFSKVQYNVMVQNLWKSHRIHRFCNFWSALMMDDLWPSLLIPSSKRSSLLRANFTDSAVSEELWWWLTYDLAFWPLAPKGRPCRERSNAPRWLHCLWSSPCTRQGLAPPANRSRLLPSILTRSLKLYGGNQRKENIIRGNLGSSHQFKIQGALENNAPVAFLLYYWCHLLLISCTCEIRISVHLKF